MVEHCLRVAQPDFNLSVQWILQFHLHAGKTEVNFFWHLMNINHRPYQLNKHYKTSLHRLHSNTLCLFQLHLFIFLISCLIEILLSPSSLLRWQWQVGLPGGWPVVFPRSLLQDRVCRGTKHPWCQALNSWLYSFRARRWLCLPLQMQPRFLCKREPQKEDAKVSAGRLWASLHHFMIIIINMLFHTYYLHFFISYKLIKP